MSRIVIVGGHGKIALLASKQLVTHGHKVTSLIRNLDHSSDVERAGAAPVLADVENLDTAAIAGFLAGHEVVIWSAGAGGGNPQRTFAVDRDAAVRSMDAAIAAGVTRYIMVSYKGSRPDHGISPDDSFFAYAEAKAAADEYLRATALEWTVLGPSRLTDGAGTGAIMVGVEGSAGTVPRADVADVVAQVVENLGTIRRTIQFDTGATLIAAAIAS